LRAVYCAGQGDGGDGAGEDDAADGLGGHHRDGEVGVTKRRRITTGR
jgi:hypothetical protein